MLAFNSFTFRFCLFNFFVKFIKVGLRFLQPFLGSLFSMEFSLLFAFSLTLVVKMPFDAQPHINRNRRI